MGLTAQQVLHAVEVATIAAAGHAGPLNPPAGVIAPTARTLTEIYNKIATPPAAGGYDGRIPIPAGTAPVTISQAGSYVLTGDITLTNTGDWQAWKTFTQSSVPLSAGQHVLRLSFDSTASGGDIGNVNYLVFAPAVPTGWPSTWGSGAAAPSEHYEAASVTVGSKIYVFGGFKDGGFAVTNEYLSYDQSTATWTPLGTLPAGSYKAIVFADIGGDEVVAMQYKLRF